MASKAFQGSARDVGVVAGRSVSGFASEVAVAEHHKTPVTFRKDILKWTFRLCGHHRRTMQLLTKTTEE